MANDTNPQKQSAPEKPKQKAGISLFKPRQKSQQPVQSAPKPEAAPMTKLHTLTCQNCKEEVAGQDFAVAKATMQRHLAKKGHLFYRSKTTLIPAAGAPAGAPAEAPAVQAAPKVEAAK
jgi:hypothetical protein